MLLLAAIFCAAAAAVAFADESDIRQSPGRIDLWTGDGLKMSLDRETGRIAELSAGESAFEFPACPAVRFEEVVEQPGAPDLLAAPVSDASKWGVPASDVGRDGSLRVSGSGQSRPRCTVTLNQKEPRPLVLSGSCRLKNGAETGGWMNSSLAINAYATYADGQTMPEQSAYFGQYDHGWQRNSRVICPDRPVRQVEVALAASDAKWEAAFRDVTLKEARYSVTSPDSPCFQMDSRVYQEFRIEESGLSGVVTYQPDGASVEIRCHVRSDRRKDRAVSAYFAIPFDAIGGTWFDDVRRSRTIEPGRIYRRGDRWYGAGRDGCDDRYPLACIASKDMRGIALAVDLAEPRVFQTEYDAARRELRIRFDLGLSPDAGRWANCASFTAYLFAFDARAGFRGAADRFHGMFEWAFRKRVEREGQWMAFTTPEWVPGGAQDLGFGFIESASSLGWARSKGMYSMAYAEPWIHHHQQQPGIGSELSGPMEPRAALITAGRVKSLRGAEYFPDSWMRYAAYAGSCIEDNWGNPQGYFFRQPGRKENMMIVNPNPALPPPEGASFSSGAWDMEILREIERVPGQWWIEGWNARRTCAVPSVEIDTACSASGGRSVRLAPVRSKTYWEHYLRGIDQRFYNTGESAGPFELSFSAKGERVPQAGTAVAWEVNFQYEDGQWQRNTFKMENLGPQWRRYTFTIAAEKRPFAVHVGAGQHAWLPDPSVVWVDDVRLTAAGETGDLLTNGSFETAELIRGRLGGVYLDTMECYRNNLNYRREHWRYADEPLTFDSARRPALQQQFSHVTLARRASEWARSRDMIVFGNCAPDTCFGAPYLDAMGGEESWVQGDRWSPKSDADFCFVRFMAASKPWCLLQYSAMDAAQQERYFKRCVFYGVYPSRIYKWDDPANVAVLRPFYRKYMPIVLEINRAGWRPLVPASCSNAGLWLERFGEGDTIYLTVFNPSPDAQSGTVTLDSGLDGSVFEMLEGREVAVQTKDGAPQIVINLGAEDLKVLRISRPSGPSSGSGPSL